MNLDLTTLFQNIHINLFIKIAVLILIGLYAIFVFMLSVKIRSFNKILFLPADSGGQLIQILAIIYFILVISLFFLTLVIV